MRTFGLTRFRLRPWYGLILLLTWLLAAPPTGVEGGTVPPPVTLLVQKQAELFHDADRDSKVSPGDQLLYTLTVKNTGTEPALGVEIKDQVDANTLLIADSVESSQGDLSTSGTGFTVALDSPLDPQEEVTITFRVTISKPFPVGVVRVRNQAVVDGSNFSDILSDDPTTPGSDPTFTPVVAGPILTATKTDSLLVDADGNNEPSPGDTLRYTIEIQNSGNQAARAVVLKDVLDPNTTLLPGSLATDHGDITNSSTMITATIGTININQSATVQFDARINTPLPLGVTDITNQATVISANHATIVTDDPDQNGTEDPTVTQVVSAPRLTVQKSDAVVADRNADGVASPGDDLEYTITVSNNGNRAAQNVVIKDTPDSNTALLVGSVTTNVAATVLTGNNPGDTAVEVALTSPLAANSTVTVTFQVRIKQPLGAEVTQLSNQAVVTAIEPAIVLSDDPGTPTVGDPTVTPIVTAPKIEFFKNDVLLNDADKNGIPSAGDTLLYNLTILNNGNQQATGIVITDMLDPNTTLISGSVQRSQGVVVKGNNPGDTTVEVNVDLLPAAASATISFQARIANPMPDGVITVSNQATATGSNFSPVLSDDPATKALSDATQTVIGFTPVLIVSKRDFLYIDADGDEEASPGDILLYLVQITNNGNAAATNVILTDTPDSKTTLQVGKIQLSQGEVITGNAQGDQTVEVNLQSIPPGAKANVGLQVMITSDAGLSISNQATVEFRNEKDPGTLLSASSDDPDSAASGDPTVTWLHGVQPSTVLLPLVFQE